MPFDIHRSKHLHITLQNSFDTAPQSCPAEPTPLTKSLLDGFVGGENRAPTAWRDAAPQSLVLEFPQTARTVRVGVELTLKSGEATLRDWVGAASAEERPARAKLMSAVLALPEKSLLEINGDAEPMYQKLTSLPRLERSASVYLKGLPNLQCIDGLGTETLEIRDCAVLQQLSDLKVAGALHVMDCPELSRMGGVSVLGRAWVAGKQRLSSIADDCQFFGSLRLRTTYLEDFPLETLKYMPEDYDPKLFNSRPFSWARELIKTELEKEGAFTQQMFIGRFKKAIFNTDRHVWLPPRLAKHNQGTQVIVDFLNKRLEENNHARSIEILCEQ